MKSLVIKHCYHQALLLLPLPISRTFTFGSDPAHDPPGFVDVCDFCPVYPQRDPLGQAMGGGVKMGEKCLKPSCTTSDF